MRSVVGRGSGPGTRTSFCLAVHRADQLRASKNPEGNATMFLAILFYVGLFAFIAVVIFGQHNDQGAARSIPASAPKQPSPESRATSGVAIAGGSIGLIFVLALAWYGGRYGRGNDIFPRSPASQTTWTAPATSHSPGEAPRSHSSASGHTVSHSASGHTVSHGGHYAGGIGSSHQGGHYVGPSGGNHYGRHK